MPLYQHADGRTVNVSGDEAIKIFANDPAYQLVDESQIVETTGPDPDGTKPKPLDKMKFDELKAYAAEHEIDLGDVKSKAGAVELIEAAEAAKAARPSEQADVGAETGDNEGEPATGDPQATEQA